MDRLPPEIILEIVCHFQASEDHQCPPACPYIAQLKHLAATSRILSRIATPFLYTHDAIYAGRAVFHGALSGSVRAIAHSLAFGGDVNRKALLRLPGYNEAAFGTALHVAVNEGHFAVVRYLVENGAQLNLASMDICDCKHGDHPYWPSPPWSALHLALCKNHTEIAEYLLSQGANFTLSREFPGHEVDEMSFMRDNVLVRRASRGVHVLEEVAKRGNVRVFRFLLAHYGEKLVFDEYRVNSLTPLHHAARVTDDKDRLEIMRTLLDRGAKLEPEARGNHNRKIWGALPFDRAFIAWVESFEEARRGRMRRPGVRHPYAQLLAFLRYLSEGERGYLTPLRERVLELWMDRGPGRLDSGWSLLYQAFGVFDAEQPKPGLIRQWVLQSLRDPKLEAIGPMAITDVLRFIPRLGFSEEVLQPMEELLLEAAARGLAEECSWFVEHGARLGARDAEGRTALHLAAREGSAEAVRVLVGWGADVGARDGSGDTVAETARRFGKGKVLAVLREEGRGWGKNGNGVVVERRTRCCFG